MIAQIIVSRAKRDGVEGFVFREFRNVLTIDQVPSEYTDGCACCFCRRNKDMIVVWTYWDEQYGSKICRVNDFIPKEDFHKLISILKEAGQRLTDINKKRHWTNDKKITIDI